MVVVTAAVSATTMSSTKTASAEKAAGTTEKGVLYEVHLAVTEVHLAATGVRHAVSERGAPGGIETGEMTAATVIVTTDGAVETGTMMTATVDQDTEHR